MVDDTDVKLIGLLARDGRKPVTSLAGELGISQAMVRSRISRLQDDNILQVVGICNALALGHQVVRILLRVRNLTPSSVADSLASMSTVNHVALISGSHDLYLEATCRDQGQLIDLLDDIRKHPGVAAIQPILVTSLAKDYTWEGLRGVAGQSASNPNA